MAILVNGWYKGSIPFYNITEIYIDSIGAGAESWDASSSQDGSIMCYRNGTRVKIVSSNITEIGDNAFSKFLALKKVTGLGSVTAIGTRAFCYTPNLEYIDLAPDRLTNVGESAFRMSSAEDTLDLSAVSLDIIGDKATRHKRWSDSVLSAVRNVVFPRTIFLDVPNPDSQENYPNVPIATRDGEILYTNRHGCTALTAYHIWNCINAGTPKQYKNWFEWYNGTLNADGNYAENNHHDSQTESNIITKLGWTEETVTRIADSQQLQTIIDRLVVGIPTYCVMHSTNSLTGTHTIAVIGCDTDTHKLAIVDSAATVDKGVISWIAFEDIFVGGSVESDRILICDYNRPILAPNSTWFTQGGTTIKRASITEIHIMDSYTPSGTITASWDASANKDGSITAYVEGTKLTLSGNGSGKISLNPDSKFAFSDVNKADYFEGLSEIHNTNLLDASKATLFTNMFDKCFALKRFDGTGWNTGNVTSLQAIFQCCTSLEELKIRDWDTGNVTLLNAFLNMSGSYRNDVLKELDLSGWNVEKVTGSQMLFSYVRGLEKLCLSGWKVHSSTNFTSVFNHLEKLKELDLSGWDTTSATTMKNMILYANCLEKIIIGEKFSFDGNNITTSSNILTLPTPNGNYVDGADGNWYDVNGNAIAPSAIPNRTFGVYYATKALAEEDANRTVLVKNGSLMRTASAIRTKTGTGNGYAPSEFADAILEM